MGYSGGTEINFVYNNDSQGNENILTASHNSKNDEVHLHLFSSAFNFDDNMTIENGALQQLFNWALKNEIVEYRESNQ